MRARHVINMLRSLRTLFAQQIENFADTPTTTPHALQIASAALLMEISRADHEVSDTEQAAVRRAMKQVFDLSDDEIAEIVLAAEDAVETAVSLYDFTAVVNERFSREQKVELLAMLWAVAYADDELDRYEEYYMRKIADLLHVSHSDYIKTKLRVMPS